MTTARCDQGTFTRCPERILRRHRCRGDLWEAYCVAYWCCDHEAVATIEADRERVAALGGHCRALSSGYCGRCGARP